MVRKTLEDWVAVFEYMMKYQFFYLKLLALNNIVAHCWLLYYEGKSISSTTFKNFFQVYMQKATLIDTFINLKLTSLTSLLSMN